MLKPRNLSLLFACMTATSIQADTGAAFYGDPPDENHAWAVHDRNRPQPVVITPGTASTPDQPGKPPSDAVILFDGTEATLPNWVSDKDPSQATEWEVVDGALQCKPGSGYIRTKEEFGDCQLHVEWAAPANVEGNSQGRGNSGVFLMGQVEIQVLDNYDNQTYADGYASSVYGVNPPMVNALRPPGEWQSYDIVFRRPVYDGDKLVSAGYVTVLVNGVVTQDHTELEGSTGHMGRSKPGPLAATGPLKLQDHGNPVRFRNIWIRPLPARSAEGGEIGKLSPEAVTAKRAETAAALREKASQAEDLEKTLLLAESLVYENDPAVAESVTKFLQDRADSFAGLKGDDAEAKKGEILHLRHVLQFLIEKPKVLPDAEGALKILRDTADANGWK